MKPLQQLYTLPPELLTCQPGELHAHFPRPTLIHLKGHRPEPLFLSILLHGNETTGLLAIQKLLKKYTDQPLPRALSLFLGNTEAAALGRRRLDHQHDYNRVWPGSTLEACDETRLMQQIVDIMREKRVFTSIDIHNNTGLNPHYACVNELTPRNLQLANLFSRTIVYFIQPHGTQSGAMTRHCPAITVECGKPGEPHGVDHVVELIEACLHIARIPDHPPAEHDIAVYHSIARVKIPDQVSFSFEDSHSDLVFHKAIEKFNFRDVEPGEILAECRENHDPKIVATREDGEDVTREYFQCRDNKLLIRKPVMLSMLTRDERVIRQDCLCYLMERLEH